MTVLLVTAGVAIGIAAWVLAPIFRRDAAQEERAQNARGEAADLESQREMALAALRDLEDDRATGKLGDRDYEEMKATLTARAVEVLRRIEATSGAASPSGE